MRKRDSGRRDAALNEWHDTWGYPFPAAGMQLPMVEYDRGHPVAVISYLPRGQHPVGEAEYASYQALTGVRTVKRGALPFLTAQYETSTWAWRVFGHNSAATKILGATGWHGMTEREFVTFLYRLRDRHAPDLAAYGVHFQDFPWRDSAPKFKQPESWPGARVSARRRNYEPLGKVRSTWLNPCTDIDLMLVDSLNNIGLVADYKRDGAHISLDGTNLKALSLLRQHCPGAPDAEVPAMVVRYAAGDDWRFTVHPLNAAGRHLLAFALAGPDDTDKLAEVIDGVEWVDLSETQWLAVLNVASH